MATYTEPTRNYTFLLSEAPGTLSRESVTLLRDAANWLGASPTPAV